MRRLLSEDDMAEGLAALGVADPRLVPVIELTGPVALRYRPPGFEGVARIVVAQQLSVASANAIFGKLEARLGCVTAESFAALPEPDLRACGLSAAKIRTLGAVAEAVAGGLDLESLAEAPPAEAVERLVAIRGIGVWTAEIFLLFCARHADIFPAATWRCRSPLPTPWRWRRGRRRSRPGPSPKPGRRGAGSPPSCSGRSTRFAARAVRRCRCERRPARLCRAGLCRLGTTAGPVKCAPRDTRGFRGWRDMV
ncbi:HhH-GPD superfamily base excision DNA repair protein [Methylobrevis pamukkalensis]|uniref:DNA-3-methyladenine glycosylase II n=1 Tax=Methylobrevis pamukkalensis TaxID=1439726 RepID=A0A1E3H6U7_9HYPH|nr:HhH-GPD superfamily base excision DNA repair protein [Methylobrevis pamukkalensis]